MASSVRSFLATSVFGPSDRSFRIFWLGLAVTQLGSWAGLVALMIRTYDQTHSTAWVSALIVAEVVPSVLLGGIFGHVLDRLPPRATLAVGELAAGGCWFAMATVSTPEIVLLLALGAGVTTGVFRILSTAVVPDLVEDGALDTANSSLLFAENAMMLLGQALGGSLAGALGASWVLAANGITFLCSGAAFALVRAIPARAAEKVRRDGRSRTPMSVGARRAVGTPVLRMIVVALSIAALGTGAAQSVEVPLLRGALHSSSATIGIVVALSGVGVLVGCLIAPRLPATPTTFVVGLIVFGLGWGLFATASTGPVAGLLGFVGGVGNGIVVFRFRSTMQRETPPDERASTIGFAYATTYTLIAAGAAGSGLMAAGYGQRTTMAVAGITILVAAGAAALLAPRRDTEVAGPDAVEGRADPRS